MYFVIVCREQSWIRGNSGKVLIVNLYMTPPLRTACRIIIAATDASVRAPDKAIAVIQGSVVIRP